MPDLPDIDCKKTFYEGRGFPVDKLSPDEFEKFVFSCLLCVQEVLGLRITGMPSGSGDGGFDVQGVVVKSNRLACVQCKRQKEPLGTPQAAMELAKVAATAAIEGSDIGEHRFICTGGVRKILLKWLRENPRRQLALEAGNQLVTNAKLINLKKALEKSGKDPRQVAETYVLGLDQLTAWDFNEFDAALSSRWSDVLQVAERYFKIASVVREHPRASFDRAVYITEHSEFRAIIEPRLSQARLPQGFATSSASDPNIPAEISKNHINSLQDLVGLKVGEFVVLLGDGGVGKSTTLKLLRAEILRIVPDSTIPVLISLTNYQPGQLDRIIHQELGVDYGTWKSLPDRVFLLCDGLNECSSAKVVAFLDELSVLLKRNRIACVLSTRESSRHRRVLLPQQPLSCLKVEGITPIGIRKIAEHELRDRSACDFVAAYRTIADGSGSPLLWTPFAVRVALRLWRLSAALPSTLGDMLDELLKARCARDAESPEQGPAPDVILSLAGAFAFQCLILDRRLECSALEAGKSIREAKKLCADALGIVDMPETQVAELLACHELLQISEEGHLRFGHQMLAGALASSVLAQVWRNYTDCLGEQIADDAWVFAARKVPSEHINDFLEATFNVDLMLGARTARELPSELCEFAERLLDRAIAEESPETVRIQGLFALARLGSHGAITKLRKHAGDVNSPAQYAAQRALAASGDLIYLRELLPRVDKMRSSGLNMTGGEIDILAAAPLPVRLDVARERLSECALGEMVGESLSLLAYERDPADADLVEKHLRAASFLPVWQYALYALHEISPTRAAEVLEETLAEISKPSERATLMCSAAHVGLDIDLRAAFECAVVELPQDEPDGQGEHQLHKLITDVVSKFPMPSDLVAVIECELPTSSGERRSRLWHLAKGCFSSSIAEYAVAVIERWGPDLGNACNYFIAQSELARDQRKQLLELCEKGLEKEETWYAWNTFRALDLVGELGFTEKSAGYLSAMIQRLTRVRIATETGETSSFLPGDAQVLESFRPEHIDFQLGDFAAHLIPAAAKARWFLSGNVLLSLLFFHTHTFKGTSNHLREALSNLSDVEIDDVISQINDPWIRNSGLVAVCSRGPTEIRLNLLSHALMQSYAHLAALNFVKKAVKACWCKEVCEMVAKTVAEIPTWAEEDTQLFWDFVRTVSKRVGPENLAAFKVEISRARTPFARRILKLWSEHAARDRVGLSALIKKDDKQYLI